MLTVQQFLEGFLTKWETSKHSLDPDDSGNYYKGALVGSKYGVTGAALANHRKVTRVSKEDVAGVTLAEAAAIARAAYYDEPQFDLLPWGPVVASAVDKCYMSGPDAAAKCLQRAAGTADDGHLGPKSVLAVAKAAQDQEAFAERMAVQREAHEALVIKAKPIKAKYRNGWNNRSRSYLPGTSWWKSWNLAEAKTALLLDVPVPTPTTAVELPAFEQAVPSPLETLVVSEAGKAANVIEVAKQLPRDTVNEVLAKAPASIVEHVTEATKLKLSEKSTWIGAAITIGTIAADPTVQAALTPAVRAIKQGSFGGILAALIGLGMVIARSKATPRTDSVIAAKRLTEPG